MYFSRTWEIRDSKSSEVEEGSGSDAGSGPCSDVALGICVEVGNFERCRKTCGRGSFVYNDVSFAPTLDIALVVGLNKLTFNRNEWVDDGDEHANDGAVTAIAIANLPMNFNFCGGFFWVWGEEEGCFGLMFGFLYQKVCGG